MPLLVAHQLLGDAGVLADWIGIKWASIIGIGTGLFAIAPLLSPALLQMKALPAAPS